MKIDLTRRELKQLRDILGPMPFQGPNGQETNTYNIYSKVVDALDTMEMNISSIKSQIEQIEAELKEYE